MATSEEQAPAPATLSRSSPGPGGFLDIFQDWKRLPIFKHYCTHSSLLELAVLSIFSLVFRSNGAGILHVYYACCDEGNERAQLNPRWVVAESGVCGCRAAGR